MLLSKEIEVTISSCTKKHYEDLGYNIPKYFNKNKNAWVVKRGTKIIVKVEDTPLNSEYIVKVKCDYCGKEHKKSIKHLRIGRNKIINKDCCGSSDCQHKKQSEICMLKYGVESNAKRKDIIKKRANSQRAKNYLKKVKWFKDRDLILLTTEDEFYNTTGKDLIFRFKCKKHNKEIQYVKNNLLSKRKIGCIYCYFEKIAEEQKLDFNFVKDCFESKNYILLETEYINAQTPMKYICNNHPNKIRTIKFNHLQQGEGCKDCFRDKNKQEFHWNWQGGISSLNNHLRMMLEWDWKKESLKKYEYKCIVTGIKSALEVHHLYSFDSIVDDILSKLKIPNNKKLLDYTTTELDRIDKKFIEYSMQNLGKPILPEIHSLFHHLYGRGKNTPEQFDEFVQRFDNHEFDDILNITYKKAV